MRKLTRGLQALLVVGAIGSLMVLGRRDEALLAISEAVSIYQNTASAKPERFGRELARALSNQSNCLAELGRPTDALAASIPAVTLYRELAQTRPDAFTAGLADALTNQASCLAQLGRADLSATDIQQNPEDEDLPSIQG